MKKTFIALALLTAFAASAQTTVDSTSGSQSGAAAGINNASVGNTGTARADSASQSGANSGSSSGAMGNSMTLNQNVPSTQNINQNMSGTSTSNSTSTATVNGNSTSSNNNTDNVKYSGTVRNEQVLSGGTNSIATTNENVHYSGTQTIKNVPGIAMSGPASGPCTGASGGLGVAGPGFGVGLNGAKVDDGCTVRENTRVLGQVYQSMGSGPIKDEAAEAVLNGMRILANMNAKIGGQYGPPPQARAEAAPAVAPAPVAVQPNTAGCKYADKYICERMASAAK